MINIWIHRLLTILLLIALSFISATAQESIKVEQYTADFDTMWSALRNNYAFFDKKATDWNKVRELYRPMLSNVKTRNDFVTFLEEVLDELYDNHTSLNTNLKTSPRLVPTGLDMWAEWKGDKAIITQIRRGFSAEQAGLKAGMQIISVNGLPVEDAVSRRFPKSIKVINGDVKNWALRAVLAGTHDKSRTITAKDERGTVKVYKLDLSRHTTVDNYKYTPKVEWKMLDYDIAYIRINDLISAKIVSEFDSALEGIKGSQGLILDIRDIPKGGNTDVAEPIMGRLIDHKMGYQQVVPLHDSSYIKEVTPAGSWTYKAPVIVLVNRWTASMGEGIAIGLDGMKRATIAGTPMAGLNGGIFNLELPNTKIGVSYAGESLNHINGTPREKFVPPVLVNMTDKKLAHSKDPILEAGYSKLIELIKK
jgi:carboxyl-terminal processing protease